MYGIIYALCGILLVQQVIHHFERKDLYTRIMSRNLAEYKHSTEPEQKYPVSAHKKVLERWRERRGGDER